MKISIIVPIFNIESYLPRCIESIRAQTYKDIEIILVDDGSTDSCSQMCDDYASKDHRITVVHKKNGGLVSARKFGLEVANGDYICHVDGDDWLHPNYVQSFANIIREYQPKIICSGEITVYSDCQIESKLPERKGFYSKSQIDIEILPSILEREDGYYFSHSIIQKCFERNIALEYALLDDKISMSEDHAFIVSAFIKADSLYVMEDCLYYYRINPYSMTRVKTSLPWSYPELMCQYFNKNVNLAGLYDQYCRAIVHMLFNTTISQFNRKESYHVICKEIDYHLKPYDAMLRETKYSRLSRRMSVFALKYRLYFLLKLYALRRYR